MRRRMAGLPAGPSSVPAALLVPAVVLVPVALVALAGCGSRAGTGFAPRTSAPVASATVPFGPAPVTAYAYPTAPSGMPGFPSPAPARSSASAAPSFGDAMAVACGGYPSLPRIVALLRTQKVIPSSAGVTASTGPLCAGSWQYTVVRQGGREPLQVVTQGSPDYLVLITAGTDVCTPLVRAEAPGGIVSLARC